MLRTSFLSDLSKSNPCTQESGLRHVATDTNGAVSACADAALGAERRTTRLVELASVLGQPPTAALPEACGDGGMLTAASRFLDHDAIDAPDMWHSPVESTSRRLAHASGVLAVQETTEVNWTRPPATQGVGPRGHTACHGRLVHTPCALTPARVPLGLLAQQGWAREPNDVGKRARRQHLPISQQASQPWLPSLDAVSTARDGGPTTRLVSVGDRDAEVSAVVAAARPAGVALRLRAAWDRCVSGPERALGATVEAQPVVECLRWHVPRRGPQAARAATLARRVCPGTLGPPRHRQREGVPAVTLWAVQVQEVDPPTDVTPIAWLLLTTVAVDPMAEAIERVEWYACRWGMAVGHRLWQSGCRIAERQWASGERVPRCLTRSRVIAWRIFSATRLARAGPDMPGSVWLELDAWQAWSGAIPQCPTPPAEPPSRDQGGRWIAQRGGFVGRRRRDQPGAETWWRGFQPFMDLPKMSRIMRPEPSIRPKPS
jgi:hypothetical protein